MTETIKALISNEGDAIVTTDTPRLSAGASADPADKTPAPAADAVLAALASLQTSIEHNARETARLNRTIVAALKAIEEAAAPQAKIPVSLPPAMAVSLPPAAPVATTLKSINWVIGPPDNLGWAYGNNAKRLAALLPKFEHRISSAEPSNVAVYFDAIIAERYPAQAKRSILRIGGPRPLDRLFGNDIGAMAKAFEKFDAIIALNAELYFRVAQAHSNVFLLPNGIDLKTWHPSKRKRAEHQAFTVGFAASLKSSAEATMKGYPIVQSAVERIGARLLLTSKGEGKQIAHDRMLADFYSKIDVLVQPAMPGREGSSNVIMEALALGIPVVTTPHSGYHGEFLMDGRNALIREPDDQAFAEAIAMLQRDDRLRRRLGSAGRAFADRHHDLRTIAKSYGDIIGQTLAGKKRTATATPRKVAFVPFWEPPENFGSSRLRALYPSRYMAGRGDVAVSLGYAKDADIVVIVQMCDDATLEQLRAHPNQFVVYDVCDKYYENPREFKHVTPPIHSERRFAELCERANLIITPSRELKGEIARRVPSKPVRFVPEPVDYGAEPRPLRPFEPRKVLWFGNPDRGNFGSARWMIEHLRDHHGFEPIIVSRRGFFRQMPDMLPYVRDWSIAAMEQAFSEASVCVVAYDPAEQAKSPNRFIAATMQGIPSLVCNSPAVSDILIETNHRFAEVGSIEALDRAIGRLEALEFRDLYVRRMQRFLRSRHGEEATAATYTDLFDDFSYPPAKFNQGRRRVAFVTHNLSVGEGAPWSLFELVTGLREQEIDVFVYAPPGGPLGQEYIKADVPLTIFDPNGRHAVKLLNTRLDAMAKSFSDFLKANDIEAVVCNTVKAAPFVEFAERLGIPAALIIRESYAHQERFSHFQGEARLDAVHGVAAAKHVVFVAETSRAKWADQPFSGKVHVIPNGISPDRFATDEVRTKAACRVELDLPADDTIALCVGTVNARKGQAELAAAFAALSEEVRACTTIVFLGAVESTQLTEFNRVLHALPEDVQAKIRVVPATQDVTDYYRASDIFLMNSSSEAYPRSIVEALFFNLPVVSTKVFGVTEQVTHDDSGFLYDFNDMTAWSQYFSRLILDQDLRARMAQAADRAFWMLTGHQEMLLAYRAIIANMLPTKGN